MQVKFCDKLLDVSPQLAAHNKTDVWLAYAVALSNSFLRFALLVPLTDSEDVTFSEPGVVDIGASVVISPRLPAFFVSLFGVFLVRAFFQMTGTHTRRVVAPVHHIIGHVPE